MESRMLLSRVSSSCKFSCWSITITFSGWAKCLPTIVVTGRQLHYPTACVPDLAYLETFVTFHGIVWLRATVLGRLGWKPSPHPRACALSCPPPAVYGPGHPTGSQPFHLLQRR